MKTSEKILEYLQKHQQASPVELTDYLGITDRAIRKQLKALLEAGHITKVGRPPKVYYSLTEDVPGEVFVPSANSAAASAIEKNFFFITPRGAIQEGWSGFVYWCHDRNLDVIKTSERYYQTMQKYNQYKKNDLINGMEKMKSTFDDVALDELFYIDFYSIEIFGKTKLGQLLLFAKQSQDRTLMNELTDTIKPSILSIIETYQIDGVGFIPPTVKRELQLMKQIQNRLRLNIRTLSLTKIKTPIIVPQKTLNKLEDRVINAHGTISVDDTGKFQNILLIDDAVGSGATLNETAKKIRQKGICDGKIIGLAITGSFKGFDVISEV